jgi:hypothetical protein
MATIVGSILMLFLITLEKLSGINEQIKEANLAKRRDWLTVKGAWHAKQFSSRFTPATHRYVVTSQGSQHHVNAGV